MHNTTSASRLFVAACVFALFVVAGCARRAELNNRYQHYAAGGLYNGGTPSLSPSNDQLAYSSPATGNGDIYVWHIISGKGERITDFIDCESHPCFSPDGKTLAYTRDIKGVERRVQIYNVNSHSEQTCYKDIDFVCPLAWSPNGNLLLCQKYAYTGGMGTILRSLILDVSNTPSKIVFQADGFIGIEDNEHVVFSTTDKNAGSKIVRMSLRDRQSDDIGRGTYAVLSSKYDAMLLAAEECPNPPAESSTLWMWHNRKTGKTINLGCFDRVVFCEEKTLVGWSGYEVTPVVLRIKEDDSVTKDKLAALDGQWSGLVGTRDALYGVNYIGGDRSGKMTRVDIVSGDLKALSK